MDAIQIFSGVAAFPLPQDSVFYLRLSFQREVVVLSSAEKGMPD